MRRLPLAPLLPLQLALLLAAVAPEAPVSAPRSLVWGPGLRAGVVLPVRYFYLQAVNSEGQNLTRSPPGQTLFKVVIKSLSPKELVRIHVPKPLDRNDGTFLMRYRMYETVSEGLKIEVLYGDEHVAQSPYILKGPVYHEYCECPEEDPQTWQKTLSCPAKEPQIAKDFASFPSINLQQMLNEVPERFGDERGAIVHYTILSNLIYRRSLGKYTDFKMFSDEILLSLARKVLLPDLEFYVNLGDWPLEHRKVNETPGPLPIISWCGSLDSRDVILPTYDITHSTLEAMRGVTNDLLSIQGNTGPSWINKTEKAFFRGRDSREERLQLVQLSKDNPQLLDAGITGYFFFQEKEKELGKAKLIGFFDFFKYKYQVNVDGTVAAYRYPYLMLGDSLVLKQDSPYYEHFYMALKPWKHYVPIKRNLSDLLEKVEWAKENDEEAKKIAKEGQLTARDLLQPHRLYCYYYRVLQDFCMAWKQESEFTKRDRAARVIQKAWKSFLAELLDAAAGINVRFRLGGFWKSTENVMVGDKKESEFHFSKLKRKQDIEKKRKIKKIEWMRQMYYTGTLEAKSTNHETLGLIHTATKGLIRAFEDGGIDSVMEWEVDEVLNWTNTLNFDEKKATENKQAQRTRFSRLLHRLLRTCSSLSLHDP
ncbi:protein O-glucosyltransferase 3 isoform X7 [Balaenoptera musculus]|uniref:Protein O-glucosyltransferase 3 isoform X7 n=1 Tax=Balaenoptera musculus TaxID=9771 RepID=A0A8B8YC58_BALMU|nr:protein O-glucosyltransferase 3 isoform X7 [Balaenoptera musculus]